MTDAHVVAHHEAGHCLAAVAYHVEIEWVTLSQTTQVRPFGDIEMGAEIVILLAGGAAERQYTRRPPKYHLGDIEHANILVRAFANGWTLGHFQLIADDLVRRRWAQIASVARELARRRRLTGGDIRRLAHRALGGSYDSRRN